MSTSFSVYFPTPTGQTNLLYAFNTGGQDLGFEISGVANNFDLAPAERVKYMIAPTGVGLTDSQASGILSGNTSDNDTSGYYYAYVENTSRLTKSFSYPQIRFPKDWENTDFYLYWLQWIPSSDFVSYGKSASSAVSFPHNLQPNEVSISGNLGSNNKTVDYTLTYTALKNEGSSNYSGGTDLPYAVYVEYEYPDNSSPYDLIASGFSSGWHYYSSGSATQGISFSLPFYDTRSTFDDLPAVYKFRINYNSMGTVASGSTPLDVVLNHNYISKNFFSDLAAYASSQPKLDNLKEVNTIIVPSDIISRRRLAIGIEDIQSVEKKFEKLGTFISNSYNLDFPIYTFSLKVDEYIPQYDNIVSYDLIKYYVEFDSGEWIRISPINRGEEYENGNAVPKMFIFDSASSDNTSLIRYLNSGGNINNFRLKIIIDMTQVSDSNFIPPEVKNYKCLLFDKEKFAGLEE